MFSDIFSEFEWAFGIPFWECGFPRQVSRLSSRIPSYENAGCPGIHKIVVKGLDTTVWFKDGSKSVVKKSAGDSDDLEKAVLYAIVKRVFGTVSLGAGVAECPGLGNSLKKILETRTFRAPEKKKLEIATEKNRMDEKKEEKQKNGQPSVFAGSYVRPDKPFSQFTQDEKRAYWRWQKNNKKTSSF